MARRIFSFDSQRKAIFLMAGHNSDRSENRFYRDLFAKADARFDEPLAQLRSMKRK